MRKEDVIRLCLKLSGAYEDYPFDEEWAVLRHKGNKKSFAYVYHREGRLCINLKCEPMRADFLRGAFQSVLPGYHMNKTHWNTVVLGGDVPLGELEEQIQHSYELTRPKVKGKRA